MTENMCSYCGRLVYDPSDKTFKNCKRNMACDPLILSISDPVGGETAEEQYHRAEVDQQMVAKGFSELLVLATEKIRKREVTCDTADGLIRISMTIPL